MRPRICAAATSARCSESLRASRAVSARAPMNAATVSPSASATSAMCRARTPKPQITLRRPAIAFAKSLIVIARTTSLPDACRDVLAVLERRVDRQLAGDHRGKQLRALVPNVLELGDADVGDGCRQARPLRSARVVHRC